MADSMRARSAGDSETGDGGEGLGELRRRAGADDGNDAFSLGQDPGNRQLCGSDVVFDGQGAERFQEAAVAIEIGGLEAREMGAEIGWSGWYGTAQQAARENAISGDADAQFSEHGKDARLRESG